jgi:hypothetical protein
VKLIAVGVEPVGVIAIGAAPTGVVAIGQLATGVIAFGQLARGFIVFGQLAIGVVAVGQLGIGMWWASGMLAAAPMTGAAMLPLSPFGRMHPVRWWRDMAEWRVPMTPQRGASWILALVLLIGVGTLAWMLAVDPVWDALTRAGGIFR